MNNQFKVTVTFWCIAPDSVAVAKQMDTLLTPEGIEKAESIEIKWKDSDLVE